MGKKASAVRIAELELELGFLGDLDNPRDYRRALWETANDLAGEHCVLTPDAHRVWQMFFAELQKVDRVIARREGLVA